MKKSFAARRVPRKVGTDEEESSPTSTEGEDVSGMSIMSPSCAGVGLTIICSSSPLTKETEPALKRPTFKPRKGTTLRKSFGPTAVEDNEESASSGVVTPKRQGLSRIGSQRNAAKRSALLPSNLPTRQDDDDDRPSYSAASLQDLKNSTPTTPADLGSGTEVEDVEKSTQVLDLSSKFGSSLSRYQQQQQQSSAIPSAAEIEEKKARRARLAKEHAADEFISLDPDDPQLEGEEDDDENVTRDENGRLILKPKDKYGQAESRLVRDDEDVMENFDEFTEADGRILLGRKAEAEAAKRRKQDMAAQIAAAEGSNSDSDSNASERERNDAFEAAQTKHGTYAENTTSTDPYADMRPRTPPKISPLPTLDGVLERLRAQVVELQQGRMRKMQEVDGLQKEKVRLGQEEVRIQKSLKEVGEWYAKLRAEKGLGESGAEEKEGKEVMMVEDGGKGGEEGEEDETDGGAGLGFGGSGQGATAGLGFSGAGDGGAGLGFGSAGPGAGLGFTSTGAGLGFTPAGSNAEMEDVGSGRLGLGMGSTTNGRGLGSMGDSNPVIPEPGAD